MGQPVQAYQLESNRRSQLAVQCGSHVGRSLKLLPITSVMCAPRQIEHQGTWGENSIFRSFFGDFVTSFASSRLASVTRDIREIFREFGGL
jgi:hypothetical protein